jgi:hypothetical protein
MEFAAGGSHQYRRIAVAPRCLVEHLLIGDIDIEHGDIGPRPSPDRCRIAIG